MYKKDGTKVFGHVFRGNVLFRRNFFGIQDYHMDSKCPFVQLVYLLNEDSHHNRSLKVKANIFCIQLVPIVLRQEYLPSSGQVLYSSGSKPYFLAAARRSSSVVGTGPGLKSLFQSESEWLISELCLCYEYYVNNQQNSSKLKSVH